jgi:AraC-like DNA-binding protein
MPRAISEPTLLVRIFNLLLADAERVGLRRGPLLRDLGLEPALLRDPDARVPLEKFIALARTLIDAAPDGAFCVLAGARRTVRDGGLVGYTMIHSATLGDALANLVRYTHILSDAEQFDLHVEEGAATITMETHPLRRAIRELNDLTLAWLVGGIRELTATSIVPLAVRFPHPPPRHLKELRAWFRCPLEFDARRPEVVLRASELDRRVISADSTLARFLEKLAAEALAALGGDGSLTDRIRRAIWSELSEGVPNLRRTAKSLGLSPRTLQRRLAEEDTSFEEIVTNLRHDLAARLLQDRRLAVYEVAFTLGYAHPSQFHRAFQKWYGLTPRAFRARTA